MHVHRKGPRKDTSKDISGVKPIEIPKGIAEAAEAGRAELGKDVPTEKSSGRAAVCREARCRRRRIIFQHKRNAASINESNGQY